MNMHSAHPVGRISAAHPPYRPHTHTADAPSAYPPYANTHTRSPAVLVGWVRPQAVTHQQRLTKPRAAQAPQSFANAPINTAASAPHNQTSALAPHAGAQ